jgi:hypothetical protein
VCCSVLVQDFIVIERPYEQTCRALVANPAGILGASTVEASKQVASLRPRVGPSGAPEVLQRRVELSVGPVRHSGDATLVAFSWESDGVLGALLPHFEGDLEVAPLGLDTTELTIRGRYDPPGGSIGQKLDRVVLHRLAESTVRAFLGDIAARLLDPDPVPRSD